MPRRAFLTLVVVSSIAWTAALIGAPELASVAGAAGATVSALTYAAGSLVCHQMPERSFHVSAGQLPVCARCLGLYVGGSIAALGWAIRVARWRKRQSTVAMFRYVRPGLMMVAAPTLVTVGTGVLGWWDPGNDIRFVLALPLGAAAGVLVAAVAAGDLK